MHLDRLYNYIYNIIQNFLLCSSRIKRKIVYGIILYYKIYILLNFIFFNINLITEVHTFNISHDLKKKVAHSLNPKENWQI